MGMWQRFKLIFASKANKALNKAEDPRETLDYSYEKQVELLTKVRKGVADVASSRKRLEMQMRQLQDQSDKLEKQARDALAHGREDLAREALVRRSALTNQLNDLSVQHAQLQEQEEKLVQAQKQLQAKVEAFRTQKETIKANYSAAEAQTRINESFSGLSSELGDVGVAIQRAQDKTMEMQARAGAIDELIAAGALDDVTGTSKDSITLELERLSSNSEVEDSLARLKGEIGGGSTTGQIASGAGAAAAVGAGSSAGAASGSAGQADEAEVVADDADSGDAASGDAGKAAKPGT